jgi:hypothetical protein
MANDVPLVGGAIAETIDEGGGVQRQVTCIGSIGKAGSETQLTAGQKVAASSLPVTLNSDPDTRPASANITAADSASTSANGQDNQIYLTGAPSANSSQSWAINGQNTARVQITNTFVGTLQFEGSVDGGATWFLHPARVCASSLTRSAVTAPGLFDLNVAGLTNLRVRATAWTSGTATVQPTFTAATLIAPPSGVAVDGSRSTPILKGAISQGQTSYAANKNIGGVIAIATGLPPGTILTAVTFRVKALWSNVNATESLGISFFDANPSSSTYADGTTQAMAAADVQKFIQLFQNVSTISDTGGGVTWTATLAGRIAVDSAGCIYVVLEAWASLTFAAANVLFWEMNGTY